MRHAFTVDVEDWFHGIPCAVQTRRSLSDYRVEIGTDLLLDLLDGAGCHGTFFVLGPIARDFPSLVRRIASAGHELACHGWSHDPVWSLTRELFQQETLRAKSTIEDCAGQVLEGYRAAYFSITAKSLWALETLARQEGQGAAHCD